MCDNDFTIVSIIIMFVSYDTIAHIMTVNPDKMQNLVLILFILYKYVLPYKNTGKCNPCNNSSVKYIHINQQMLRFYEYSED